MRALIVYAHPEPTSFTAAMRDTAQRALEGEDVSVQVSDLYADGFEAVAGRHDFTVVEDQERFHYQREQQHAARHNSFAADIAREQERLSAAHLVLFVYPLWWGGVPAILKGWFDRVLAYGFAYEDGMRYDTGYLRGRRALMGVTTGGTSKRFTPQGAYGSIEQVLWPTQHCMIEYLGLETLPPYVAYASPRVPDKQREAYLAQWADAVRLLVAGFDPQEVRPLGSRHGAPEPSLTCWKS